MGRLFYVKRCHVIEYITIEEQIVKLTETKTFQNGYAVTDV